MCFHKKKAILTVSKNIRICEGTEQIRVFLIFIFLLPITLTNGQRLPKSVIIYCEREDYMANKEQVEVLWKDRKHYAWFPFSFTKYSLKNGRVYTQTGFFNTHYDELLLYRITDICLTRTLGQKFFGTGTIVLYNKIDTDGKVLLQNIKKPVQVKELLSKQIEESRTGNNVVGKEFYGSDMGMGPHGMDDSMEASLDFHDVHP